VLLAVYGLKQTAQDGPGLVPTLALVAGIAVGVVFVRLQRRLDDPMLDLGLFRSGDFTRTLVTYALSAFVGFSVFMFIAQYLQLVQGFSTLATGLWMLPASTVVTAASLLTPAVAKRVRPAALVPGSLLLSAIGLVLLALTSGDAALPLLVAGNIVITLGIGPLSIVCLDLLLSAAPPERAGAASGLSETGVELGGALGIALLGSLAAVVYRAGVEVPAGLPPEAAEAARDTLGGAAAVAGQLPADVAGGLLETGRAAFSGGFHLSMLAGAALTVLCAVWTRRALTRQQREMTLINEEGT
jgi:DHA2 family multidrug resistance protein-like MFS transporter